MSTAQERILTSDGWILVGQATALSTDMASDANTSALNVLNYDMCSVQVCWTGANTTTGVFQMQESNDQVNWCNTGDSKTVDGASGCAFFEFTDIAGTALRVKFTSNTTSAGTFTARASIKTRR